VKLENKVAIVTGGAQGIGRAIAVGLAHEGAHVVIADLQLDKATETAEAIEGLGGDNSRDSPWPHRSSRGSGRGSSVSGLRYIILRCGANSVR